MFSTLRTKLLVICLISVALAMAGQVVSNYVVVKQHAQDSVKEKLDSEVKSNVANIATWVQGKRQVVASLKAIPSSTDKVALLQVVSHAGSFSKTYACYPDKHCDFSTIEVLPPSYDPSLRPWYKEAISAGKMVVTAPFKSVAGDGVLVTIAEPLYKNGALEVMTASFITLETVIETIVAIKPSPHSFGFLIDGTGVVISYPDAKLNMGASTAISPELTASRLNELVDSKQILEVALSGQQVLLRVARVPGSSWFLGIALDRGDALAGLDSMLMTSAIVAAIILALVFLVLTVIVSRMLIRLRQVRDTMQDVASGEGDLTIRVCETGTDELSDIGKAYNQFANKLVGILREIRNSSESVKVGASEIAAGNLDLSSRTEQQASSLGETAAAMDELSSTVAQNAENSHQANEMAISATAVAVNGGNVVKQVIDTMSEIKESAKKITEITSVINGIAFQTNILALNAAVEAARAGEQGRGFAVVAAEVRNLAQRSATAAKEIKALIESSSEQVSKGGTLASQAGEAMAEIVVNITRVKGVVSEISAASAEQNSGISQVHLAITNMDSVTQQNAALVEEAAAASGSLLQQAEELSLAVSTFKLG